MGSHCPDVDAKSLPHGLRISSNLLGFLNFVDAQDRNPCFCIASLNILCQITDDRVESLN